MTTNQLQSDTDITVAYIILHFNNVKDTEDCIESLLKNDSAANIHYVIVDNGSRNELLPSLKAISDRDDRIHLILNNRNLGYARGNNAGIDFARQTLNASFIIVINNDTIVDQLNFSKEAVKRYFKEPYALLGPDIRTLDGKSHQNPPIRYYHDLTSLRKYISNMRILYLASFLGADKLIKFIKRILIPSSQNAEKRSGRYDLEIENTILHGSCIVFSPDYFNKFDGFYPETFLFGEEEILYFQSMQYNLKTLYCPDVFIVHKEDGTLNNVFKRKSRAKRAFVYKNKIASALILKKLMILNFPEDYQKKRQRNPQ